MAYSYQAFPFPVRSNTLSPPVVTLFRFGSLRPTPAIPSQLKESDAVFQSVITMDGDPAVENELDSFSRTLPLPFRVALIIVLGT